jgi:uncharacterized membrane protein
MATEQRLDLHRSGRLRTRGDRHPTRSGNRRTARRLTRALDVDDAQLTTMLGWFSVGLGLTEVVAPRFLGNAIGVGEHPGLMRALGVREIANGVGLLTQKKAGSWAWARVAGDAMDLALLGAASQSSDANPTRIAAAATAVMGVTALDVYAGQKLMDSRLQTRAPRVDVSHVVTINVKPDRVYEFWRQLDNLPLFVNQLQSVSVTGDKTSHWVMETPAGITVEWDSEITEDVPGKKIAWRTLPSAEVRHWGVVSFEPAPAGRGTVLRVDLRYEPPAGMVGRNISRLMGSEPRQQLKSDLLRLKQLIETGEIASTDGQPHGERSLIGRGTLGRFLS